MSYKANKIYVKFDVNQTVWYLKNNLPICSKVKSINIKSNEHLYTTQDGFVFTENQLEPSKKELFKLMKKQFMEYNQED